MTPPRAAALAGGGETPVLFRWVPGGCSGPFEWVLLDASYHEVARHNVADRTAMIAPDAVHRLLQGGGTWHWYVLGDGLGRPVASRLETIRIL
ncbi:MAG: hypothetical protein JNK15_03470 [Planctomycetes bacterium]|nr:hypothetical protein [Planctomycetota bacterium]